MTSQKEQIRAYLESGGKITPIAALRFWGCFRLGARINNLRNEGMNIKTEMITDENGKHFAEYSLKKTDPKGFEKTGWHPKWEPKEFA